MGKDLRADIEVLKAIRVAHPDCSFILDANEGYTAEEAVEVLDKLHGNVLTDILCVIVYICTCTFALFVCPLVLERLQFC